MYEFCSVHYVKSCINIVLQVCTSTLMTAVMENDFRLMPRTASTARPVISSVPVRTLTGWRHREARGRLTMACECWVCLSSHLTCNEESEGQTEVRCHYRNCFSWLLHNQCKKYLACNEKAILSSSIFPQKYPRNLAKFKGELVRVHVASTIMSNLALVIIFKTECLPLFQGELKNLLFRCGTSM